MCIAAVFPFVSPRKSRNFEYVKNFNAESVSTPAVNWESNWRPCSISAPLCPI